MGTRRFLHAGTPARLACALPSTPHCPRQGFEARSPRLTLLDTRRISCAPARGSSLTISRLKAPSSKLSALSSPNATRQADTDASRSWLQPVRSFHTSWEWVRDAWMHPQPAQPALQAPLGAILASRFLQGGLLDGLPRTQTRQMSLLDAARGISADLLSGSALPIHNHRLSILLVPAASLSTHKTSPTRDNGTDVPACSGTRPVLRHTPRTQGPRRSSMCRAAGEAQRTRLDRARYTPTEKTRGPSDSCSVYPLPRFRLLPHTCPVKATWKNRPPRCHRALLLVGRCTRGRFHSGGNERSNTFPPIYMLERAAPVSPGSSSGLMVPLLAPFRNGVLLGTAPAGTLPHTREVRA